mmetsp:Transcript_10711/g.21554  ORF Transcript_10711/g.21554 Transcript_10711/m.21554 type:complete len:644 (+) Transcript_10711:3-1934(+)
MVSPLSLSLSLPPLSLPSFPSVKACTLLLCLLLCSSDTIRSATADASTTTTTSAENSAPSKLPVVSSIRDDLEYDENGKLASHHVVFPANRPDCGTSSWEDGTETPGYGFTARPLEGDAFAKVFEDKDTEDIDNDDDLYKTIKNQDNFKDNVCRAACLEKGTDIGVAGHTMPRFHYRSWSGNPKQEKSRFERWFRDSCIRVEVCFINYVVKERPLAIYWVDPKTGKQKKQVDLMYSESKTNCFHSFLGHEFVAIDEKTDFYESITIDHITTKAFGTSPPSSSQKFDGVEQLEATVKRTLDHEWSRHQMVERTFSSLGFSKGRLPDDVFANMGSFYYNNRNNVVNEEWEGKGVFVNWWETDVKFVSLPWDLKHAWQQRLNTLVSEWAGVPIEETSMYGLRQYEGGARLLSHVDRIPTHAVSLIVNIAQHNLASPWPVEVFDHGDRLHEVIMDPGDIVYYESAKNLHSRNRPLVCKQGGCSYINLFTHYRPVNDGSSWHRNLSDMPNRPPPLLKGQVDYDAETTSCSLPEQQDNGTENTLGVGIVECNDNRLGSHVSPTFHTLESAKDLFRWWKATEDPNFIRFDETDKEKDDYDYDAIGETYEGGDDDDGVNPEDYIDDDDDDDDEDDDNYTHTDTDEEGNDEL